jgi:purine-cytosine permease-like protein
VSNQQTESKIAQRLDKLYEFDRQPVTPDKFHGGRRFAAIFAGEHVAATEFVIGALFVSWGAGARDIVLGLLLGNLFAVLSWAFICAPIATDVRLTLYWYIRRILGPGLTVIYNIVNAVLYCCLAAAMIGVSASAVIMACDKLGWHITHPTLKDTLPNSVGWVIVVALVGAVVITLAIAGFKKLSQFAGVCSPWMFTVFLIGALVTLPKLGDFHSISDLWTLAKTQIWTGEAAPGTDQLGFWHITFFAWFCNLAMHVCLSDMALLRYARHWSYGFYSAFGMYLGHYLAWICAGIMGAAIGSQLNPGEMAHEAAGFAGILAVLIAGWTTANPTIYRAGLALQIITPNWPRWAVTLAAGGITTVVGFFPAIFMQLLDFVAIYGLCLMPVGAIIFVEHWLFPKLGLRQYWAEARKSYINMPALISWVVVMLLTFPIEQFTGGKVQSPMALIGLHLFYRWLPGWFISAGLYIVLAALMGARVKEGEQAFVPVGAEANPQPAPANPSVTQKAQGRNPIFWVAGAGALLCLFVSLGIAIRVFMADPAQYDQVLGSFKQWFMAITVIYFVFAITWASQKSKDADQA